MSSAPASSRPPISLPTEMAVVASLVVLPAVLLATGLSVGEVVMAAVGAVGLLLVTPTLLAILAFSRRPSTRATAHVWSLATNTAALFVVCLALRETVGIGRVSLVAAWLGWTLVLFVATWRRGESIARLADLGRRFGPSAAVGLAGVLVGIGLLWPEQFVQCFSEDGTETYQLARSLDDHLLPAWELETWDPIPGGRTGTVVVNPSLVNSYWTFALQTLLGRSELATRLPYWVWWLGIVLLVGRFARPDGGPWWTALPSALLMLLVTVLFTFYVGYNRYMADLANPGVTDALFTLLLLMGFDCLRQRDARGWAVAVLMASLVLYAGGVMFVLTVAAAWWWQPVPRRELVRWSLLVGAGLVAAVAFYVAWGWADGSLPYWIDTLDKEYIQDYLADVPRWQSGPFFLGYFLLGSGVVTVWGLVSALRRDPWQRTLATVTLAYLAIVLGSGFKNLHWLAPLWPVPLVLFLAPSGRSQRGDSDDSSVGRVFQPVHTVAGLLRRFVQVFSGWVGKPVLQDRLPSAHGGSKSVAVATVALLICLVVVWPRQRATFTLNRELGQQTTIATADPLTAATWARIRLVLRKDGLMSWECDEWTWADYAELDPRLRQPRSLVLTTGPAPSPEYQLLAEQPAEGASISVKLYCRDPQVAQWLASRRVLDPTDRYPPVFQPLARGKFSPHDNELEDVRRLR